LPVVENQREVLIPQRTKFKQELVFLLESKLLPLVGLNLVEKTATRVIGNFLQKRGKGMGGYNVHNIILWVKDGKGQLGDDKPGWRPRMAALVNGLVQGTRLGLKNDLLSSDFFTGPLKQARLTASIFLSKVV
jgi:hypothetical protein